MWKLSRSLVVSAFALSTALCLAPQVDAAPSEPTTKAKDLKVIQLPLRSDAPKTIDPGRGSTTYDNRACSMVYDTLLQYKYLKREPFELEPALLTQMPVNSADGLTWTFQLKKGVVFQDNECFEGGKGRELVSKDVFYSWKRQADDRNKPKSWWLYKDTIVGFDEFKKEQNTAEKDGESFNYDAPVAGMKIIDDHNFQVVLTEPVYRFIWILAMFQTSVVPREAVEHYGNRFSRNPVGTGPYQLDEWTDLGMSFNRNPTYREEFFPKEWDEQNPANEEIGLEESQGLRLPIVDRVEYTFYKKDQPMWLRFEEGTLGYTQVPAENYETAFNRRTQKLNSAFRRRGIKAVDVPLLDFIFRQFNMEDELVGGYTPEKIALRRAIILATDFDEFNSSFYNDKVIVYDGMIPPGLDGHPNPDEATGKYLDHRVKPEYRGKNIALAKEYLVKAGYPNGEGLPPINYYVANSANSPEQADLTMRQLGEIGVKINVRMMDFSSLIEACDNKKAAFFSFAWSSDYPDAENNLALFYGPNVSPGSNHANYQNDEFDRLYEQTRSMEPSPERTKIYEHMRDIVLDHAAFAGSMARTRSYLIQPWLRNFNPTEQFYNWIKYLDVDESLRE
ncbi:MAG: oligopeptide transport system substrate-binding protein [Planctomycetota bacterium]|jgi:oligopeptide transport system substrate-binding protein